ncbi:MAG: YlmC/YmxH family sporulation protein [Eubacteriales bacterium]
MARCTLMELREKEVINVCDGRRLGCVEDLEFDPESGRILALLIPEPKGLFSFGNCPMISVGWQKIQRIGADIILVDIGPEEPPCCEAVPNQQRPPKKGWFH